MTPVQDAPSAGDGAASLAETLQSLGFVDVTALAVLFVFAVLGLVRGFAWQLGRLAILVVAYAAALALGPNLADVASEWLHERQLAEFLAFVAVFVGALVVLALIVHAGRRLFASEADAEERASPTPAGRLAGGVLGALSGWLVLLALLTGVYMLRDGTGFGTGIAEAASRSHTREFTNGVLERAGHVLPDDWQRATTEWRILLDDPTVGPPRPR